MTPSTNVFGTKLPRVHEKLHQWYRQHGRRDLPWRNTCDSYPIYVSEVMLQQTQVKTVLERYYHPFLATFPTLAALAAAPEEEVMKLWEGLGYYSRARNLHAASQQCDKGLPDTVGGLMALPGVGRNTAHAVACFGFGAVVPVMEANVKRVLARLFALQHPEEKMLWSHAEALLDKQNPFDYNQAMMDIGALVCTRRAPRCGICPLSELCSGKGEPESYPAAKLARKPPLRRRVILVYKNKAGKVWLRRRSSRFLGGLYGFAEYEHAPELSGAAMLGKVRQVYSHFTLEAEAWLVNARKAPFAGGEWFSLQDLGQIPLSRADAKIAALLVAYEENMHGSS